MPTCSHRQFRTLLRGGIGTKQRCNNVFVYLLFTLVSSTHALVNRPPDAGKNHNQDSSLVRHVQDARDYKHHPN